MARSAKRSFTGIRRTALAARKPRSSDSSRSAARPLRRRYVICVSNANYPASLEQRKIYVALNDAEAEKHDLVRVIDESGEDYLYPMSRFVAIPLPAQVAQALDLAVLS